MPKTKDILTESQILRLEEAFSLGCTDSEACFHADIGYENFKAYLKIHPEFADRREVLKQKPLILARQTVLKAIREDPKLALEYLDRLAKP